MDLELIDYDFDWDWNNFEVPLPEGFQSSEVQGLYYRINRSEMLCDTGDEQTTCSFLTFLRQTDAEEIKDALRWRRSCYHEYDCCGCTFASYVEYAKHLGENEWMLIRSYHRNY